MRAARYIAGAGALLAVAGLVLAGALASWSPSGWLLLLAAGCAAAAQLCAGDRRARRVLARVAATLCLALVALRASAQASGPARMLTLPNATSARWAGRIFDEEDTSLVGARLLGSLWRLPRDEQAQLVPAVRAAYVEMRQELGTTPSPLVDTLLARQRPGAFDALVIEPPAAPRPRVGLVFLHGYAGSSTLECWLVARAARAISAVTVCPATEFSGHWSRREGEQTVRATLGYLRARGVERVYLAGLSNGAAGASALASRLAPSLSGLLLISGAPATGGTGGLPTLVLHGERDSMASAAAAHAFAARTHATYVGLEGGHFALLIRRDEARDALAGWLRRREVGRGGQAQPAPVRRAAMAR